MRIRSAAPLFAALLVVTGGVLLASGLIDSGMAWWQALLTILLGNTIVLVPILLNSHPGTRYGVPFPVLLRSSYGTYGANIPALMRALVACGWFGINAWIGGAVLHTFFTACYAGWPTLLGSHPVSGYLPAQWLSFLLFWGLNVVDATVDAHLKEFDISDQLSMKIKPSFNALPNTVGLSFVFTIGKTHSSRILSVR